MRSRWSPWWGAMAAGLPLGMFFALPAASQKPAPNADWEKGVAPFLKKFCVPCHQGAAPPGGVSFANLTTAQQALAKRAIFDRAAERMKQNEMPPPGVAQPTAKQRADALLAIQRLFAKAPAPASDPGRVTMRRLNRAEYDNTVRDLLGVEIPFSADFPNDDVGYGFDNIGDVLTLSPLLFEKYLNAAEKAAEAAIVLPESRTVRFGMGEMRTDTGRDFSGVLALASAGYGEARFRAPKGGPYQLRVTAWAQQAGPDPARMAIRLDGKDLTVFDVQATQNRPARYELPLDLKQGENRLSAHFINDYYQPQAPDPKMRGDRNLYIESIEVIGPLEVGKPKPASHRRLMTIEPDLAKPLESAKTILRPFLKRAFRRPVADADVERFARLVPAAIKEGQPFEQGIRVAVAAALVSPYFLFRVELDTPGGGTVRNLNDYELASRLSYFLWSSMPDAELFALADAGKLRDPKVLEAQAARMLQDPKAEALTRNFASQWLTLRKLENVSPDPELFPTFNDDLRQDMEEEVRHFFANVVKEDRSVVEFLDAPYTFVNARLARHYGLANVTGPEFRRVALKSDARGGLLTSAAVLTVTSNPNRTSPVKRGKWVLENILGEPPPPPPPGLDALEGDRDKTPAKTIKERMARHRKDPSCAVCHAKMDPLGMAFENYDPVGKWRTMDGKFAVDPTGTTAKGEPFKNAADLKKILLKRKDQFVHTLAEKLMTYGLGRGVELSDRKAVEGIASRCRKDGYRFSALVKGIVISEAFRKKRV